MSSATTTSENLTTEYTASEFSPTASDERESTKSDATTKYKSISELSDETTNTKTTSEVISSEPTSFSSISKISSKKTSVLTTKTSSKLSDKTSSEKETKRKKSIVKVTSSSNKSKDSAKFQTNVVGLHLAERTTISSKLVVFHVSLGLFAIFLGLVATIVYLTASNYEFLSLATGIWAGTIFIFVGGIATVLAKKNHVCWKVLLVFCILLGLDSALALSAVEAYTALKNYWVITDDAWDFNHRNYPVVRTTVLLIVIHCMEAITGLAATIVCVVHVTAVCCGCCCNRASRTSVTKTDPSKTDSSKTASSKTVSSKTVSSKTNPSKDTVGTKSSGKVSEIITKNGDSKSTKSTKSDEKSKEYLDADSKKKTSDKSLKTSDESPKFTDSQTKPSILTENQSGDEADASNTTATSTISVV